MDEGRRGTGRVEWLMITQIKTRDREFTGSEEGGRWPGQVQVGVKDLN